MRWAEKQRHTFMCDHLAREGWLGRGPLMDKFDISKVQAATDLRKLREMFPLLMKYDASAKRYVVAQLPEKDARK